MPTYTNVNNTENQSTGLYDRSFIFLGDNSFESQPFKVNAAEITLVAGTVMGRVSATGTVIPLVAAAADGSNIPFGILAQDIVIPIGDTPNLSICVEGKVAIEKLIFDGAETVATVVSGRRLDDRISGDTVGIKLVSSVELTAFDNV